jgi:hypothetical protein
MDKFITDALYKIPNSKLSTENKYKPSSKELKKLNLKPNYNLI